MAHGKHNSVAVSSVPLSVAQHTQAADALYKQGRYPEALAECEKALQADANYAPAWYYRGMIHYSSGRRELIYADFDKALKLAPDNPEIFNNIAKLLMHLNEHMKVIPLLHRALELDAGVESAWLRLAECYYRVGKADTAHSLLERAGQKFPHNQSLQLLQATFMPQIIMSQAEGDEACAAFMRTLDTLMQEGFTLEDPVEAIPVFPFYHAYYGINCKPLMEKMAAFFLETCPSLNYTAPHCRAPRRRESKLRIGFVTEFVHTPTIMQFFSHTLTYLSTDKELEVTLFAISNSHAPERPAIAENLSKYVPLPCDLPAIRAGIAREELDVLMYLEIGLGHYAYFTAFSRLAPVQCTWGGHPVTTGIPNVDYFLSFQNAEADHPETHYSETPLLLKHSPTHFARPEIPEHTLSRRELGLPEHMRLYACPVQLFKIHPDMDEVFKNILERDPQACLVLFFPTLPLFRPRLEARFSRTIPPALRQRILFLPYAEKHKFLHILQNADAILDPFHFSLGTTAYLAFSMGLPFATCPGEFFRSRAGYWAYRLMDMPEMIAPTHEAYTDLAIRLANDKSFRDGISAAIRARSAVIFDDRTGIADMVDHFKRLSADRAQ